MDLGFAFAKIQLYKSSTRESAIFIFADAIWLKIYFVCDIITKKFGGFKMKKSLNCIMLALLVTLTFSLVACNNYDKPVNENTENHMQHYEIDLTLDNYWKFIDVSLNGRTYTFNGVLSYAYYIDVQVDLTRTLSSESTTNTFSKTETVKLNASGGMNYIANEYSFDEVKQLLKVDGYMSSYRDSATIKKIVGKVIFSI